MTCTYNAAGLPDLAARHEEEDKIRKKRTRSGRRGRDQEEDDEIRKKTTRSGRRRRDQEEDDEISLWRLHLLNLGSLRSTHQ
jgi:DNA invertase Pin-like site-specific DNA recombinase